MLGGGADKVNTCQGVKLVFYHCEEKKENKSFKKYLMIYKKIMIRM